MKNFTLLLFFLAVSLACSAQNLIVNGDFETDMLEPWGGFNNQVTTDDLTSSLVGNANNGEASIFQEFDVTPGETYKVTFQYRWVSGPQNYNCIVRIKDAANLPTNLNLIGGTIDNGYKLDETPDMWFDAEFSFSPPEGVTKVRLLYYKANQNRPLRIDNVSVVLDETSSVTELQQVFNFRAAPNPASDLVNISADQPIDWVELYAISGQLLSRQVLNSDRAQLDVSNLPKGLYVVKAQIANRVGAYKLIVD